ncbi:MAG: hypothetical protein V2J24_22745 [Pseudomonadales bacterium]|jgi:hypothetical protein|nr:hypothetical protein [Pseudomonadales bacterium]
MGESTIALLGLVVTVLLAVLGWLFVFLNGRADAARAARLERIDRQLRDLYGPLYVRLEAGNRVWRAFWAAHRPAHGADRYFGPGLELSEAERATWRLWMKHVFEPMNAAAETTILQHVDLLESDAIPDAFVDALAHIAAFRAVLARWEVGDFSEHVSVHDWPHAGLMAVVEPELQRLKARQRALLAG